MPKVNNTPTADVRKLNGQTFTGETVRKIRKIWKNEPPKTSQELRAKIDGYFDFCEQENMRPGIEGLCLYLGTNRMTFWNWCQRDNNFGAICRLARQAIVSFLEEASQTGHVNPATSIFALKNWAGYQDVTTIEAVRVEDRKALSADQLPRLGGATAPMQLSEEIEIHDEEDEEVK